MTGEDQKSKKALKDTPVMAGKWSPAPRWEVLEPALKLSVGGGCVSVVFLRFQRTLIEIEMKFVIQVKEAGGNKDLYKIFLWRNGSSGVR